MHRLHLFALAAIVSFANCTTDPGEGDVSVDASSDLSRPDVTDADVSDRDVDFIDVSSRDVSSPDAQALDVTTLTPDAVTLDAETLDAPAPDAERIILDPFEVPHTVETLSQQFRFIEGPVWRPSENELIFCDINPRTLFRYKEDEGISTFLTDIDCNGSVADGTGLVTAGAGGRDLKRIDQNGTVQSVPLLFQNEILNSPNDLFLRNGDVYFTDPGYGIPENQRGVNFNGLYRLEPNGTLSLMDDLERQRPNGIILAADRNTAYLSSTEENAVYKYDIDSAGNFGAPQVHGAVDTGGDGIALDEVGNLYVTTSAGVEVLSPTGAPLGVIELPLAPANCTFGGADLKDLYITARTTLYRVRLPIAGLSPSE